MTNPTTFITAAVLGKGSRVVVGDSGPILTVRSVKIRGRNVMVVYETPEAAGYLRPCFPKMIYRIDALVEVVA